MSRQKSKGTKFETACARWLTARLGDPIERRALHGSKDMGDLFGLKCHGWRGIAECKSHKAFSWALVDAWREETANERANADADFALLLIDVPNVGAARFGHTRCDLTLADLFVVAGMARPDWDGWAPGVWVTLELEDVARLMLCERDG